jgi:hypothetical protein
MTRAHVTCLDCGAEFVRSNGYQGNYCQSCHEEWTDTAPDHASDDNPESHGPHPAGAPATRQVDDEDDDPSQYDEE